jgi:hypothetical protein
MEFIFLVWYFAPFFLSLARKHNNALSIFFVNLFFGWTLIGWFWAFIWATTSNRALPKIQERKAEKCNLVI